MNRLRSRWCLVTGILAMSLACAFQTSAQVKEEHFEKYQVSDQLLLDLDRIDGLIRDGHYNEAEEGARNALESLSAQTAGPSFETAILSDRLVEALLGNLKVGHNEALNIATNSLRIKEQLFGTEHMETALSKRLLGQVLTRRLEFAEAQLMLDGALDVSIRIAGSASLEVAEARHSLGRLFMYQSLFEKAREEFSRSLAIREAALGNNDLQVAISLWALGDCNYWLDDLAEAEEIDQRALEIYTRTKMLEHPDVELTLTTLGQIARKNGNFDLARSYLEQAVGVAETALRPDSPRLIHPLSALGLVLTDLGEYAIATQSFERALSIATQEFGAEHLVLAGPLSNYAQLRLDMGYAEEAERLFAEASRLNEKFSGPWNPDTAASIESRGIALAGMGRLSEAEHYFERALEIRIHVFGEAKPMIVVSLHNLSVLTGMLGDYVKQKEYAERALAIMDKLGDKNDYRRGAVMFGLGSAYRNLGDLDEALRYSSLQQAAMERVFGPFHVEVARALLFRARLLAESGQHGAAITAGASCETLVREHVALTTRSFTEAESLQLAATRFSSLGLLITLATSDTTTTPSATAVAWDAAIRGRALVLNELINRRHISTKTADPELAKSRETLASTTANLAKLIVNGADGDDPSAYLAAVDVARQERERAERDYATRNKQFQPFLSTSRAGYEEVKNALTEDAALVAFLQYGEVDTTWPGHRPPPDEDAMSPAYVAFVLHGTTHPPRAIPLGSADEVNELVERFREALAQETLSGGRASASGEAGYRQIAGELRARVWDPVAALLDGAKEIFIVPDGALQLIDFAALPTEEGRYLAETQPPLHYLSTERDLLIDPHKGVSSQLLAVGAPDFDGTALFAALKTEPVLLANVGMGETVSAYRGPRSACGSFQTMLFEPLPESSREVAEVAELWSTAKRENTVKVFTGIEASETTFKQQAPGMRVLHIATHGFFLGGDCGSALTPLEGDDVTNENPLLLSGLVLAGANHRTAAGPDEDDGILTAEEIATMDLGNTEWAVLSACNTGRGEIRSGEGVLGLQRAFRIAGVRTTIMSLWPVDDEITRRWMASLYRHHFAEGLSTMESVHAANLDLLLQRRAAGQSTHPFYWAGLIASGDWR